MNGFVSLEWDGGRGNGTLCAAERHQVVVEVKETYAPLRLLRLRLSRTASSTCFVEEERAL